MFSGGNRIPARRVHDDDSAASGRFEINVIHSDPSPPNDPQTTACFQDCFGHLGLAADNERAEIRDRFDELSLTQPRANGYFQAAFRAQLIDSSF
jgi:hypothetical protein